MERLEVQCRRFLYERHGRKPQAALHGESLRGQSGRPDPPRQAVLLLRFRMGSDCAADRHCHDSADAGISGLCPAAIAARRGGLRNRIDLSASAPTRAVLQEALLPVRQYRGDAAARCSAVHSTAMGPLRAAIRPMETVARTARAFRIRATIASRCKRLASTTTSIAKNMAWFRFQSDTGLQAAYTDPINPLFNAISPQPLYSFASGYTHVFSGHLVNYFNPAFSWYREPVRASRPSEDAGGVSNRPPGQRRQCAVHHARRARQYVGAGPARHALLHQRQSRLDGRLARTPVRNQQPDLPPERL